MAEKLSDNLEEALEFIQKLQAENTELKATVGKQNIMLSNLNEMLVKNTRWEHLSTGRNNTGKLRVLTLTGRPWRTG